MPKKVKFYYTFKPVIEDGELKKVEAHKWEASGEHTGIIYKVDPGSNWHACSCPAWRQCKHMTCVEELIASGRIQHSWKWRWDEVNGWQELDDIQPIGEI